VTFRTLLICQLIGIVSLIGFVRYLGDHVYYGAIAILILLIPTQFLTELWIAYSQQNGRPVDVIAVRRYARRWFFAMGFAFVALAMSLCAVVGRTSLLSGTDVQQSLHFICFEKW
jgi:hypothetical protein